MSLSGTPRPPSSPAPTPSGGPDRAPTSATAQRPPGSSVGVLASFWDAHREPVAPLALAAYASVGVVGAWLLVGHRLGLGAALVGLLLWAPAVRALIRRRAAGELVTAALAVALVAMVAVRDADWVVGLCLATATAIGAVAATSARSGPAVVLGGLTSLAGLARAVRWLVHGAGRLAGARRAQVLLAVRSVGVTVVLLAVFGVLFASADRVFASYVPTIDVDVLPAQVVVAGVLAALAAAIAQLAVAPPAWSGVTVPAGRPARLGEWLLPVAALDALVLAFVAVQVGGLIGGHRHVLETVGLSYAQYAREGFAQLVVVTALTLLVVAVAARHAPRADARERLVTRIALAVLCLGTLGVVASALRRMGLYVDAFGLTRLRLFVEVVEVVLAVVLVLVLVAGVRWRARWLPRAVVQVVAVAMLALALANPDALIARHNTTNVPETGLDVFYLRGLSADAAPTLDQLDEPMRSCLLAGGGYRFEDEAGAGGVGADGIEDVAPVQALAEWNLGRERAERVYAGGDVGGGNVGSGCDG
ncbi:DUF4153 domain-containing protein [Pengzhenrongella sicca]|uniref:DUF4173 domain-containing protein n=1 Tax=Pengzhenrongella sicca TaxID=2819238 RepID=A0A8A4ZCA6_9MICO|nr:DUF4173 domain-containing protein [Pengzhenrongella sicca]QTE29562.1 DUF4173 domain-containing protein [Pengzhenrongella sicca]